MWRRLAPPAVSSAALLLAVVGAATLAVDAGFVAGRELASAVALAVALAGAAGVAGRRGAVELASAALIGPVLGWGAAHALDAVIVGPLELPTRAAAALVVTLGVAGFVSSEAATRRASARASADP